jgi:hypothetical protein
VNKRELIALFGGGRRGGGGMDSGGRAGQGRQARAHAGTAPLFDVYVETLRALASDVARERQRQSAAKA